jgi:hypothetical protein
MAKLALMPAVEVSQEELARFGETWRNNGGSLSRTPPYSSTQLGNLFDEAVGKALAVMLGGISVVEPMATSLTAQHPDCVEVGPVRIIGGVRPQNFDVGYRPDGVRFAFDSKTLNDAKSVGKNSLNMINDLATEATTVHSRFPHAVVAFMFIVPSPCFTGPRRSAMIETLERLARRVSVGDPTHLAEAIALVVWNPEDGSVDGAVPAANSPLRLEKFSPAVEAAYISRYKGLPPHAVAE